MPTTVKKTLREIYERIQKGLKDISQTQKKPMPQWALQPYRPKRNLRGTDLR
jgi:hypothetical protein